MISKRKTPHENLYPPWNIKHFNHQHVSNRHIEFLSQYVIVYLTVVRYRRNL